MTKLLAKQRLASHKVTAKLETPDWFPIMKSSLENAFDGAKLKFIRLQEGDNIEDEEDGHPEKNVIALFSLSPRGDSLDISSASSGGLKSLESITQLCKMHHLTVSFSTSNNGRTYDVQVGDTNIFIG